MLPSTNSLHSHPHGAEAMGLVCAKRQCTTSSVSCADTGRLRPTIPRRRLWVRSLTGRCDMEMRVQMGLFSREEQATSCGRPPTPISTPTFPISHLTCGAEAVCNTPCRVLRQGVFLISSCGDGAYSRPASVRRMKYSSTPAPMRARRRPFMAS